jgi:O-antigen ligase
MEFNLFLLFIAGAIILPLKYVFSLGLAVSYSIFFFAISDVATLIFVILFVRMIMARKIDFQNIDQVLIAFSSIIIFSIISILWAKSISHSLSNLFSMTKILIIGFISLNLIKTRDDFKFIILGAVGGFIYILIALIGWKNGQFGVSQDFYLANIGKWDRLLIQYLFPERHTPINSNTWAALVSISFGLIAYYLLQIQLNKKLGFALLILLLFVVGYAIFDLGSRSSLIGLFGCILLYVFPLKRKSFLLATFFMLVLYYSFSGIFSFLGESTIIDNEVLNKRLNQSVEEIDPRVPIWNSGLRMALDNPIGGVGVGNSGERFFDYKDTDFETEDKMALHNSFLTFFAELGMIGLALFLRFLYLIFKVRTYNLEDEYLYLILLINIFLLAYAHSFEQENHYMAIIFSMYSMLSNKTKELEFNGL